MLTHDNLLATVTGLLAAWAWEPDDALLLTLPLFHTHGLVVGLHCALAAGATVLLRRRFDAAGRRRRAPGRRADPLLRRAHHVRAAGRGAAAARRTRAAGSRGMRLFCSRQRAARAGDLRRLPRADRPRHPRALRHDRDRHEPLATPTPGRAPPGTVGTPLPGRVGPHRRPRRAGRAGRRGRGAPGARQQRLRRLLARPREDRGELPPRRPRAGAGSAPATSPGATRRPATSPSSAAASELILSRRLQRLPARDRGGAGLASRRARGRGRRPAAPGVGRGPGGLPWSPTAAGRRGRARSPTASAQLAGFKVPRAFRFVEALPRNALGKVQKHLLG